MLKSKILFIYGVTWQRIWVRTNVKAENQLLARFSIFKQFLTPLCSSLSRVRITIWKSIENRLKNNDGNHINTDPYNGICSLFIYLREILSIEKFLVENCLCSKTSVKVALLTWIKDPNNDLLNQWLRKTYILFNPFPLVNLDKFTMDDHAAMNAVAGLGSLLQRSHFLTITLA